MIPTNIKGVAFKETNVGPNTFIYDTMYNQPPVS